MQMCFLKKIFHSEISSGLSSIFILSLYIDNVVLKLKSRYKLFLHMHTVKFWCLNSIKNWFVIFTMNDNNEGCYAWCA